MRRRRDQFLTDFVHRIGSVVDRLIPGPVQRIGLVLDIRSVMGKLVHHLAELKPYGPTKGAYSDDREKDNQECGKDPAQPDVLQHLYNRRQDEGQQDRQRKRDQHDLRVVEGCDNYDRNYNSQ